MKLQKINLSSMLGEFSDHWNPRIIAELNGQQVKIAKVKGEFIMHNHENEDELFFVISGQLFIKTQEETIILNPGELMVIPKGVDHKPFAKEETAIMMFEPSTTLNTGNIRSDRTRENLERL